MMLSWAPIDGALFTVGSRQSAINLAWRQVPPDERTPTRRKLIIALVDHVREYHERTGKLAPPNESLAPVPHAQPSLSVTATNDASTASAITGNDPEMTP